MSWEMVAVFGTGLVVGAGTVLSVMYAAFQVTAAALKRACIAKRQALAELKRAEEARDGLEREMQLLRSHMPRMHEMAFQLNRVDGVCSCEDCRLYRERNALLAQ